MVRQPEALVAEDQRGTQVGARSRVRGERARRPHGRRKFTQTCRHGGGEIAAFERLADIVDNPRTFQYIIRAAGKRDRFRIVQGILAARCDEDQLAKAHGLDGAGHGADIASAAGVHQYKAQALKKRSVVLEQVHLR
jgi:hypothetical protein